VGEEEEQEFTCFGDKQQQSRTIIILLIAKSFLSLIYTRTRDSKTSSHTSLSPLLFFKIIIIIFVVPSFLI